MSVDPRLPTRLAWIEAFADHLMEVMPRMNALRASEIAVRQYEIVGSHDAGDAAAAYALMTAAAREVLGHAADLLSPPLGTAAGPLHAPTPAARHALTSAAAEVAAMLGWRPALRRAA